MTEFDPYDDAAILRRQQQEVLAELAAQAREDFERIRPIEFAEPGTLDPRITPWAKGFLSTGRARALIIVGTIGAGKTWTLWKLVEALIGQGWRGKWDIVSSYELKEATDRPVDRDLIAKWRSIDLLCIDDIGAQRINDWDMDALHALIDTRRQHQRATVITSNTSELRPLLGERVASRVAGGATAVVFNNEDRRRAM